MSRRSVRMADDLEEELSDWAARHGVPVSSAIRACVFKALPELTFEDVAESAEPKYRDRIRRKRVRSEAAEMLRAFSDGSDTAPSDGEVS